MQKLLTLLLILQASLQAAAQHSAYLDINNVKACFTPAGDLFRDSAGAHFEVPKGSGINALGGSSMWIGGYDPNHVLHLAAQTFKSNGSDFFAGPMLDSIAYSATTDSQWNRVWKINKSMIDSFRLNLYPTFPAAILNWPAQGNPAQGSAQFLAPFFDTNGDGIYDPSSGDYPCIRGDQAIFFIYNDSRNLHTASKASRMGIEIHGMAYAYKESSDSALNNTIFINYQVINRSANTYKNTYVGNWSDQGLGNKNDDFTGCDVRRSMYYAYNGFSCDSSGAAGSGTYGCSPPAQAVALIQGPLADPFDGIDNNHNGIIDEPGETFVMSNYTAYNNTTNPINGVMTTAADYYNYMSGKWRDGSAINYGGNGIGGGTACTYMFPGNSDSTGWGTHKVPQLPWSEGSAGSIPGQRFSVGSFGPFTLSAGGEICLDFVYVWGRQSGNNMASVEKTAKIVDSVKVFYASNNLRDCSCHATQITAVPEHLMKTGLDIYPNPVNKILYLRLEEEIRYGTVEITDLSGRLISQGEIHNKNTNIDLEYLPKGLYILKVKDGSRIFFRKFIKQ
jgi:hypothetical protein